MAESAGHWWGPLVLLLAAGIVRFYFASEVGKRIVTGAGKILLWCGVAAIIVLILIASYYHTGATLIILAFLGLVITASLAEHL